MALKKASPVNIWMHTNMLTLNGQKMAKSMSEQMTIARSLIKGLRAVENQTRFRNWIPSNHSIFFISYS